MFLYDISTKIQLNVSTILMSSRQRLQFYLINKTSIYVHWSANDKWIFILYIKLVFVSRSNICYVKWGHLLIDVLSITCTRVVVRRTSTKAAEKAQERPHSQPGNQQERLLYKQSSPFLILVPAWAPTVVVEVYLILPGYTALVYK